MEKEIFIKKIINEDDYGFRREMHRRHEGVRINEHGNRNRGTGNGFGRSDKGRGNHLNGGRRDGHGPHQEEGCNTSPKKYQNFRHPRFDSNIKTKMFTSKKDLVEYVNKVGELGNKIDIFKIEDDLYKVVILERFKEETPETK